MNSPEYQPTGFLERICRNLAQIIQKFSAKDLFVCLATFISPSLSRGDARELYSIGGAAALTSLLFISPANSIIGLAATYRIVEVLGYRAFFLLVKSIEKPWESKTVRRSLLFLIANYWEVTVGFAIIYGSWGKLTAASGIIASPSPMRLLYFSAVTMATVGYGDLAPADDFTRFVVVSQIFCNFLFIAFLLPALISAFAPDRSTQPNKDENEKPQTF